MGKGGCEGGTGAGARVRGGVAYASERPARTLKGHTGGRRGGATCCPEHLRTGLERTQFSGSVLSEDVPKPQLLQGWPRPPRQPTHESPAPRAPEGPPPPGAPPAAGFSIRR